MTPYIVYTRAQVKADSPAEARQYVADALYDQPYVRSVIVDSVLDGTLFEQLLKDENVQA